MVTVPGPREVPVVTPRATRQVRSVPYQRADQVSTAGAEALGRAGTALVELTNRMDDQRIENEIVDVEMRQRKEIDALTATFERDTEFETFEQRFSEAAGEITARNLESLSSQRARNLWQRRANETTYRSQQAIANLSRERRVEMARAGLITNLQTAEATLQDDNATAEARALAMQAIEGQITTAQARGILDADDAAQRLATARNASLEFERTRGIRAAAQEHEDRIWAESGGDMAVAQEMARELEPLMRDTVMDRIGARYSQGERARENNTRTAMEQALTHLENGGSLDGLSAGVRDVLTRAGQMDALRAYISNRAGSSTNGRTIANQASEDALNRILADAQLDYGAFARADLTPLLPLLNSEDRATLQRQQAYRRGEAPATDGGDDLVDQSFTEVWDIAPAMAQARGVRVTGSNPADQQRAGRYRTFLMRATRRFVQANGRQPSMAEREQIVNSALLAANGTERVFENRIVQNGSVFGMGGSPAPRIRITINDIPQYEADLIAREYYSQYRREPTPQEIETIYSARTVRDED